MTSLSDLACEVARVTGAELPDVLSGDAPVPTLADAGDVYFVGLIGGKDVGKTSLANAIAGAELGKPTGHGEGTRAVTAYAHRAAVPEVRRRLGDVAIVPHELEQLRRQVLLDLPDIDSRYADHITLTRQTLRHLLYPVWVQSVEKYADKRPRDLLAQVAQGNDPGNFVFVLSKADQLVDREGTDAALEVADDYAGRVADALELPAKPEVLLCSAHRPEQLDLPRLREKLGIDKEAKAVRGDMAKAGERLSSTVASWVREQNLPALTDKAKRQLDLATELVTDRAASPVLQVALPRLADDPGHRAAVAEPAARARTRAWPLVGWIDMALSPVVSLIGQNLMPASTEAASLERHLADAGHDTAQGIRSAFATLRSTHPDVAEHYASRHLWESAEAETAAADLRRRLSAALDRQRDAIRHRLRPSRWLLPIRWLLTVGVVVWFAIAQPLLEVVVPQEEWSWTELLREAVLLINAQTLLASAGFVLAYLLLVWAAVRVRAYRLAARQRHKLLSAEDDDASPAHQVVLWTGDLVAPLRDRHAMLERLSKLASDM
ncbi:MAG: hypothetical protein AAGI46_08100 [Planctomycetota bacterium]